MIRQSRLAIALATFALVPSTGCIIIANGNWLGGWPTVWTGPVTERIAINTDGLTGINARTHNGSITVQGQDAATEAYVIITKKAGARTAERAVEAMAALDVFVEPAGTGTQKIGYRWKGIKQADWRAAVQLEIHAPANVSADARTHNGPVKVTDVTGDLRVETHNGSVRVAAAAGPVYARTHNGSIVVASTGDRLTLGTHNGTITADVRGSGPLDGKIQTHNGGVELTVGDDTSTEVHARTHNGSIRCNVPVTRAEVSRHRLTGAIGSGEGRLAVTTHNGSVHINKSSG